MDVACRYTHRQFCFVATRNARTSCGTLEGQSMRDLFIAINLLER